MIYDNDLNIIFNKYVIRSISCIINIVDMELQIEQTIYVKQTNLKILNYMSKHDI